MFFLLTCVCLIYGRQCSWSSINPGIPSNPRRGQWTVAHSSLVLGETWGNLGTGNLGTSMIGNCQGRTAISPDLAE
jgi:hypothetical protein